MKGIALIDIIFASLLIILAIRCYLRGFVKELLSMAGMVLGFLASFLFYKRGADFIRVRFMPNFSLIPEILAFIAIFLIVLITVSIVERILQDIIQGIRIGGVDRLLGIFFGLAEGIIVVSLVIFVITIQPLFNGGPILEESLFARVLLPFISGIGRRSGADALLLPEANPAPFARLMPPWIQGVFTLIALLGYV